MRPKNCFIVTGSIGPKYQPRIFSTKEKADGCARNINDDTSQWPRCHAVVGIRDTAKMAPGLRLE